MWPYRELSIKGGTQKMEKLIYSTNIFRWHIYAYLYTIWKVEAKEGMSTIRLEEKHKTTKSAFFKVIFGGRKKRATPICFSELGCLFKMQIPNFRNGPSTQISSNGPILINSPGEFNFFKAESEYYFKGQVMLKDMQ